MSTDETKVKEPPVLFDKTQAIVKELSTIFNAPIITYWNSYRGGVCQNDVIVLYDILENIGKQDKIYLFINSGGGNGSSSSRIINLLRQYASNIIALVPLECASAATMLAIGADEIQMGPLAFLTAVDTSLTHDLSPLDRDNNRVSVSLDELNRIVKLWEEHATKNDIAANPYQYLFEHVHPLVIGAVDRAESLSIMLCEEILTTHMKDKDKIQKIADTLNSKYPSHAYPIMYDEAKKIGLNVTRMAKDVNTLLLDLHRIYSEMGQKATVDYDEKNSHSNEILNIHESSGKQIFYQNDKDWFYRAEERRWITLNDNSSWHKIEKDAKGKLIKSILHVE
ncbi:MAG: ATP-dependent Clp protease proteolytic subunit [Campylobacteraceae bacterium]|nr:ATP-dependent Clp protease proteolytic subunit [Campylobacteraceae bacterium]